MGLPNDGRVGYRPNPVCRGVRGIRKGPAVTLTVRQLAEQVHGEVAGDGDLPIADARALGDARPGDITFIQPGEKNLAAWHNSPASAAVAPLDMPVNGRPLIRVADPLAAFAAVVRQFRHNHAPAADGRIDPTASVHPTAKLGPGTTVGPFVAVGEGTTVGARCHLHAGVVVGRHCTVGDDCTFYPHVVLYDDSVVGLRVTVHANTVLGADGFGYRTQAGRHVKVPQLGSIEIGDDVDIGACATIDRGTFGPTRIGAGTKIDNLVMIGHNCQIGRHNLLVGQVGMAGSCSTGDYVVMAGQVGVADHLHIGDRAVIGAQSGIMKDVPDGSRMFGYPARPDKEAMRITACMDKVPDLVKEVKKLKAALGLAEAHE